MASNSSFSVHRDLRSSVPSCPWPVASHFVQWPSLRFAFSHHFNRFTSHAALLFERSSGHALASFALSNITATAGVRLKSLVGLSHQQPSRQAGPFGFAHRLTPASSPRCRRSRLHFAARANPSIQGTVEKLRFSIPSALRASAAPDLER